MLRRPFVAAALVGVNVMCFGLLMETAAAQDAQAEATAKATKRQTERDTARSAINIATPTDVGTPVPASTTPPPETEKLKRRAGEQIGGSDRGQSLILGMHVKEAADGGVEVVDVGAATPAREAGIRKGDEIISFENFKADSYRKWIDGIRRVATSPSKGSILTVVVSRDGNPVTTKVRVPEDQVGPIKLPLGPQPGQAQNPAPNQGNPIEANGGDSNVLLGGNGTMAAFFSGAAEPGSEKAVAELFRIGPPHKAPAASGDGTNSQAGNAAAPQPRNDRVGFAGFRNDANGMLVMVDVGGLEPGNYTVSIADAGVLGNQAQGIEATNTNVPQVKTGASNESSVTAPATGQVQPLTAPATGQVNPSNTLPTGRSGLTPGQGVPPTGRQTSQAAAPMPSSLGTLTVDQSGTGRLQQIVEAIRVRSVVGQALVIYATGQSPDATTLPPNLDATADPSSPKPSGTADATTLRTTGGDASANHTVPVVGGRIHLLSDRGSASTSVGDNATPAAEQRTGQRAAQPNSPH